MTIDVARARADTPGTEHVVHLNNAGAALMPRPVIAAQRDHLDLESRIGGYEAAAREAARIDAVYDSLARLINAAPDEIAVVENATVGWDMAFYALPFGRGDRILTAGAEYAANYLAYLQVARRTGAVIEIIPSMASGETSPEALEAMIDDRVKLISVTHVPTNGGLVNPAAEIGAIARRHGIPFLLDACQSVGQMPIDVAAIGCDMLTATGRKFLRGPRGIGFLYVRRALLDDLEPPMIDMHSARWVAPDRYELRPDARRFENWENNYAAKLGLGAAADYALDWGLDAIADRVFALGETTRRRLDAIPGVTVRDIGRRRCGIVSFTVDGIDADEVKARLGAVAINVSVSTPSSTLLDATERGLPDVIRASVHYYNDEDEIDRFADAVTAIARG
ncbi:MAG: aminotransferase class V-fold PLP-dependent enzyme [Alphaproteobacteria bacterium]|nr:aminotransferase class V-fold PLP-dependent enzyme [Alphaproteobacteria bacterium]